MVPGYWPIEVLALMSWLGYRYWARGPLKKPNAASGSIPVAASQCSLLFVDVNR
jgi:hypothetical protein